MKPMKLLESEKSRVLRKILMRNVFDFEEMEDYSSDDENFSDDE